MPMSKEFERRLFPHIPAIIKKFGSPFFIYDEAGIRSTGEYLKQVFAAWDVKGFREFYAAKALPNPEILRIMRLLGFGFDCSSVMELEEADFAGALSHDVMFTSNNTSDREFREALKRDVILNLDDISMIDKLKRICATRNIQFPVRICFRYNPGKARRGNTIIGQPEASKYGITDEQLIPAYRKAKEVGASRFGIHTMICSNQRNWRYMVATVRMLLKCCKRLEEALGIKCEYMNMGGGLGVNYKPGQKPLDVARMAEEIKHLQVEFESRCGWVPKLYMESGRYMTAPHGVLVATVINRKDIYQTHIGVDACPVSSIPRHMIYGAYHHVTVLDPSGRPKSGKRELVNVVGPACENTDRFATSRMLPLTSVGDLVVVHEGGAHCYAMASNYNSRLRPPELLFGVDGVVRCIRRAEKESDLWRTLRQASKTTLKLK